MWHRKNKIDLSFGKAENGLKIVVLAGGLSMERCVSLSSGSRVCRALRSRGHKAVLVDMFLGLEDYEGSVESVFDAPDGLCPEHSVASEAPDLDAVRALRRDKSASMFGEGVLELCKMADVVFLGLHGTCGEDGRVQAAFDLLGIPYTGSGYLGSAIAMDKDITKRLLKGSLTMADWRAESYTESEIEAIAASAKLPCVVKPLSSGSSIGVTIAKSREEVELALRECLRYGGEVMLEQYIQGREVQVGVLDGKALPSIEIIPNEGFYDYANKYQSGAATEVCPAEIPEEWETRLRTAAETAYERLGLEVYARADFIVTADGTPYFLEINTLPGMTPTSLVPQEAAAVGMDYAELCEFIVEKSLEAKKR